MKPNTASIARAIAILVFLTILPIVGRGFIPSEFIRAMTIQSGFDVIDILNRIAAVGIGFAILVALRGHIEKASTRGLALSSVWKVYWLIIVFFLLGLGHPETLGLAVLGGKAEAAENTVVFDFRLFAFLATVIVALMIARSVLQFREDNPKTIKQETKTDTDTSRQAAPLA
jgi:hypothetical protein